MSMDVSLGQIDFDGRRINTADDIEVGSFPSDMVIIWNWVFAKEHEGNPNFPVWFGAAHHEDCALWADHIARALTVLFNPYLGSQYDPEFFTASIVALVKVWKACRDHPDHNIILSH